MRLQLNTEKILAETEDGVAWLTFNNAERRNAISLEMWQALITAFEAFEADSAVRVVVLRGAGDRAFASGADISQFESQRHSAEAAAEYKKLPDQGRAAMGRFSKPLIAMIRGYCIGGGLGIAMRADIRISADDGQFAIPAARLGLAYTFDSLRTLTELVGPAYAKEILFTGRRLNAEEALRIGLVNRVVPVAELEETTRDYASMIARNAPLTVKSSKVTVDQIMKDPEERDLERVEELTRICMDSEDYAEGRRAFMEKRTPSFVGR